MPEFKAAIYLPRKKKAFNYGQKLAEDIGYDIFLTSPTGGKDGLIAKIGRDRFVYIKVFIYQDKYIAYDSRCSFDKDAVKQAVRRNKKDFEKLADLFFDE